MEEAKTGRFFTRAPERWGELCLQTRHPRLLVSCLAYLIILTFPLDLNAVPSSSPEFCRASERARSPYAAA